MTIAYQPFSRESYPQSGPPKKIIDQRRSLLSNHRRPPPPEHLLDPRPPHLVQRIYTGQRCAKGNETTTSDGHISPLFLLLLLLLRLLASWPPLFSRPSINSPCSSRQNSFSLHLVWLRCAGNLTLRPPVFLMRRALTTYCECTYADGAKILNMVVLYTVSRGSHRDREESQ